VKDKIESERPRLGRNVDICNGILGTLPLEKQQRVANWYMTGGPDNRHDVDQFLGHVESQFEDKEAQQSARLLLTRIRMGDAQKFDGFLQDFEYKLSQGGGLGWPDDSKITYIYTAINPLLRDRLVTKDLPEDDYPEWIKQVRKVASKLQDLPEYKKGSGTKTWYLKSYSGYSSGPSKKDSSRNQGGGTTTMDVDGDTRMTGVNGIQGDRSGSSSRGRRAGSDKPRAKWLTKEETERLREKDKCFRCKRRGHFTRDCPDFRAAQKPSPKINATSSKGKEDSSDPEDSGESDASDTDQGKE
jgi:hypothetical protein